MGLDMYAFAIPLDAVVDPTKMVDFEMREPKEGETAEELCYWRKFNHLHGWMERLYRHKGGDGQFNCNKLRLTEEDIEALAQVMRNPHVNLAPTAGFFFGGDEIYDGDIENTNEFIAKARVALSNGMVVYYDSWW